jgi:prepilin-type N-terminal cleavage/methylation domain-containing protein
MTRSIGRAERGFSLIEIMVGMTITTFALTGTLALYNTATRANRSAERLSRATRYTEQMMEQLRGMTVAQIESAAQPGDAVASNITYHRSFSVTGIPAQSNLVLVKATVIYGDDGDESAAGLHTLVLESLRTRVEQF